MSLACIFLDLQVVHEVGLCIALWDIIKMEDSYILPGDGASHTVGKYPAKNLLHGCMPGSDLFLTHLEIFKTTTLAPDYSEDLKYC